MPRKIAFTGHRNVIVNPTVFARILAVHGPDVLWCHGGAPGYDSQVAEFARLNGVPTQVIRPDSAAWAAWKGGHGDGLHPYLARNLEIIAGAHILYAAWDGRTTGGTYFTVRAAAERGIWTTVVPCRRS